MNEGGDMSHAQNRLPQTCSGVSAYPPTLSNGSEGIETLGSRACKAHLKEHADLGIYEWEARGKRLTRGADKDSLRLPSLVPMLLSYLSGKYGDDGLPDRRGQGEMSHQSIMSHSRPIDITMHPLR